MNTELYFGIPAYNEEENIADCLLSLAEQDIELNLETIVCLNGCTDKTEKIVEESKAKYPRLNIRTVHSDQGISFAQNAIVRSVGNRDVPLVFVDADVTLDKKCISILYEEMARVDQLIVVGGWPVPTKPEKMNCWERFLYGILHLRAFYPESEVSENDVSQFKSYVEEFPQPEIDPNMEAQSKIYFHGRIFMIRDATFFEMPEDKDVVDDTYLPNMIHTNQGPGTIRTRFDAIAYYKPYISLRTHFKTYRRVFLDLQNIDQREEFRESRKMEETKLDWKVILSKGPFVTSKFLTYATIVFAEQLLFRLLPNKSVSENWQYQAK